MEAKRAFQRRILRLFLTPVAAASVICASLGCSTAHYVLQAGIGQLKMSNRARPIEEVVKNPRTEPRIREMLKRVEQIRAFGQRRGLKETSNYTTYVQLDQPAAVWVVSACEELEFKPRTWSFPIAGSFTYLGWFDREAAEKYANRIREEGLDIWVRGASAYSTLGWFRDPVYSSMIRAGADGFGFLANTVLHEGVHDTVYIDGQSYFNESLASFFADKAIMEYFDTRPELSVERDAYVVSSERGAENQKILHQAYLDLEGIYRSRMSVEEKRARKKEVLEALKGKLGTKIEHNNASLIQYKTYASGAEEFSSLFRSCDGDWKRFFQAVGRLRPKDFPRRQAKEFSAVLKKLQEAGC